MKLTLTPESLESDALALQSAARLSVNIDPDRITGVRPGDPLLLLIPDAEFTDTGIPSPFGRWPSQAEVDAVRLAIAGGDAQFDLNDCNAARLRAQMRRWAMRQENWAAVAEVES